MILKVETGTANPILRKKSEPIKVVTKKILKLIKDMMETMEEQRGVGLAAPQIGVSLRLILVTLNKNKVFPMINPKIIQKSDETDIDEEGCLSLPGIWGKVRRSKEITVQFQNIKGQQMVLKFEKFEAREIQHEIDHLDGILFTDYLKNSDITLNESNSNSEATKI